MSLSKSFKIILSTILSIVLICTVFTGCSNSRHLKDLVIVEGMGLDKKDDEINLIVQTLNVGINNGAQTPEGGMTLNTQKEGVSIIEAINNLSRSLSKRIFFGQNKIIVVGKELAEDNFTEYIDYFNRSSDARSDIAVCISDSEAEKIIESKEDKAAVPCENILYLLQNNEKAGLCSLVTTGELLNLYVDKTSDMYLPVVDKEEKKSVSTKGVGLFSGDKLVHVTDDKETAGFVIMTGEVKDISVETHDEKLGRVGVRLSNVKCKKSADTVNSSVAFHAEVKCDMIIEEIENGTTGTLNSKDMELITSLIESTISDYCIRAFIACRDNESDCLRVGEHLARDCPEVYSQISDDWHKYFRSSVFSVNTNVDLKKISDNTQVE